ncbi:MAG: META domain-containing protein [Devosia sp.]
MRIVGLAAAFAALFLVSAMPALAERIALKGDVTYRERIALPDTGTLSVSLIDLAEPAKPGLTATAAIARPGKVPLTFTLNLDTAALNPRHNYALVAEIAGADGTVWFRNAEPYAVDPQSPAEPILIVVNFQGSTGTPAATAVPEETAAPAPILGVTWKADSIAGTPVAARSVSSLLIGSDMRAGGRGGCNSWFAQAALAGQSLAFSAVAATRIACPDDTLTAQETAFFDALGQTRFYRLAEDTLTLLDVRGRELAVLEKWRY